VVSYDLVRAPANKSREGQMSMNEPAPQSQPSWVQRAFRNPYVGMTGWLATVVSVPLAISLFIAGQEAPDLTYFVQPDRASLVAAGDTSDLRITYKGRDLAKNVSAAQIVIWNAGKRPIRHEDILTPYLISLTESHPVVTAKIVKVTNPVTEFRIDDANILKGQVGIEWRVLEKNDGAIIQIIYEGDTDVPIQVAGIAIGQRLVDFRKPPDPTKRTNPKGVLGYVGIALMYIWDLFLIVICFFALRTLLTAPLKQIKLRAWIMIAVTTMAGVGMIFVTVDETRNAFWNSSPFGN